MTRKIAWIRASRPPAQTFIFPSLLFGQGIYYSLYAAIDWYRFVLIHLYGIFMHLYIVFANDYADYETDLLNKTYTTFTGGSRVLVEGKLKRKDLLNATLFMYLSSVITGAALSIIAGNWLILLLVFFGLKLLWAYSFYPIKLSYRGFGETLQVIGVGIVLPLIGYTAQGGSLTIIPWFIIFILLPAQMGMAISTSLPDQPSDKISLKRTTVVILGSRQASFVVIVLNAITLFNLFILRQEINRSQNILFYLLPISLLVLLQLILSITSPLKPGSKSLYYFVLLSILVNLFSIVSVTYLIVFS